MVVIKKLYLGFKPFFCHLLLLLLAHLTIFLVSAFIHLDFSFLFTSSIAFLHSSHIFLVSVHRSFGSQSISFNTANVFFYVVFKSIRNVIYIIFWNYGSFSLSSFAPVFDINSSWSVPQSVPGLILAERTQPLHLLLPLT